MRNRSYTPELIAAAIRGDDAALSFLYESTQDKVTQTVRSMIRDEDAVLDIVQDSFVKAFRNLDKLNQPEYFPAWMRRIASNTAVDYMKKKRPMLFSELASEDGTEIEFEDENIEHLPDVLLDQQETSRLVQEIVSGLSEDQQLAIGLFYFEGRPIKSIAKKLGCSENTVKSRLNYGRKNIEKQVRELERKGTKLYSMAPLPFFLWLLRNLHSNPSQDMLGAVLAECANLSFRATATANYTAAKAGAKATASAAKAGGKAVSSATKKLTAKIVAGILATATVVGGAAIALSGGSSDPTPTQDIAAQTSQTTEATEAQQPTQPAETTAPATEPSNDPIQAYQVILDELKAASRHPYEDGPYYYFFHQDCNLYYCLYDIDKNGIDELLIGRPYDIAAIFAFDGEQTHWLLNRYLYGMTSQVQLTKTGEVYVGSPNAGSYFMMRLAEDGCSFDTVFQYHEVRDETGYSWYESDLDDSRMDMMDFNQMMLNDYTQRTNLRWKQFTGTSLEAAQNYLPILNEYVAACADEGYLEHREQYPNTLNTGMDYYHSFGPSDVSYALLDIDENGTDELLIGTPGDIWDIYAFDGENPIKLVNIEALGSGRATLTVMDSGELYIYGASGAADVSHQMLRLSEDGISTETVFFFASEHSESSSYYEGLDGSEHVILTEEELNNKLNQYNEAIFSLVSISEIPSPLEEAYQVILDEYKEIVFAMDEGTYSPGQLPHARNIIPEKLDLESDSSGFHLAYCYYDIDQNGTYELLIGYATEYGRLYADFMNMTILDVYTYDGNQAVQLFQYPELSDTAYLVIETNGHIYLVDKNQPAGKEICLRIASDGYSPEVIYSYQTRWKNGLEVYFNDEETLDSYELRQKWGTYYGIHDFEWTGFAAYSE